ncbi:Putrescine transporter PotE [Streptomyces glaucescens]
MHDTGTVPAPAPQATAPRPAAAPEKHTRRFGLPVATALVMGNIIGGGIFLLPAAVAPFGTVSLVAFAVLTAGAIALALVFGRLAHRDPRTGGPYVYAREAFGDFAGFLAAWAYWITTGVSNAALAVAAVGYLDVLIPVNDHAWTACLAALVIQWLPALSNFAGSRYVGAVQFVSTVLKFAPLLLVAVGGLFFFGPDNLGPFNASGDSALGAVAASAAILLFSYLGVESAAVSAGEVRDPRRNVGRATVIGTLGAALVYLLGTFSVFGTVAHDELVGSSPLLRRGERHVRRLLGRLGRGAGRTGVDDRLPQRLDPAQRPDAVRGRRRAACSRRRSPASGAACPPSASVSPPSSHPC